MYCKGGLERRKKEKKFKIKKKELQVCGSDDHKVIPLRWFATKIKCQRFSVLYGVPSIA